MKHKKASLFQLFSTIFLGTLFAVSFAEAQSTSESFVPASPDATTQNNLSEVTGGTKTRVEGYFRVEGMRYPKEVEGNSKLNQSLLASTKFKAGYQSSRLENQLDITAGKYLDLGGSTFIVSELYGSAHWRNKQSQVSLGRKIEFWSQVDQDWQLGLWQPKSLLDSLRPEDQGLTGVFYKHQYDQYEILAYASPVFIPTMGPEVKEKNGSLVSDSRWYRTPSQTFPLFGKDTSLVYDMDVPDIGRLVGHAGGGIRMKIGGQRDGFWSSFNLGYKPVNSLLLKYRAKLFLPEQDPQTGEVTISPEVGRHTIWGGDIGYRVGDSMFAISFLQDKPDSAVPDESWVLQNPQPLKAYSAHFESALSSGWFDTPVGLKLSYLKIDGGKIRDYDREGVEFGAIFEDRTNFRNAASARLDFSTAVGGKRLMTAFKFMREFEQRGSLMNTEVMYYPTRPIALVLGVDILGVDDDSEANADTGFLNQFRANDRVYGGMSYVF